MRNLALILAVLLVLPACASAAIARDVSSKQDVTGFPGTGYFRTTISASATALCVANQEGVSATEQVSNVQIGTAAGTSTATKMGNIQVPSDRYIDLWCLLNPPTGTVTVQVDASGGTMTIFTESFTGVGAIDAGNTNSAVSGTTFAVSTVTTQANAFLVSFADNASASPTAGANTAVQQSGAGGALCDSNLTQGAAGSKSMNWSGVSTNWGVVIAALEPNAVAGPAPSPFGYFNQVWW